MAFEFGVWRIDNGFSPIALKGMPLEKDLEDILYEHIEILNKDWLVIGKQINTSIHGRLDLLAIDRAGNLVVIELKRNQTPREVVAQVLDYGAWVRDLKVERIAQIFDSYVDDSSEASLDSVFQKRFGIPLPDDLNMSHQLVIVATELDAQTERIINYLSEEYQVEINAMFFRVIEDEGRQYLSRVWLIDPADNQIPSGRGASKGVWNGEYYASFGYSKDVIEDGLKLGYLVAGGGRWYSRTLELLSPGDRVWVNVPGHGYVGCGRVTKAACPVDEFTVVDKDGKTQPIQQVSKVAATLKTAVPDWESADFLVAIDWDYQVGSLSKAKHEKGFFGNQNSVARPTVQSWEHTVKRLKAIFGIQ
jgi:hypothetical protein